MLISDGMARAISNVAAREEQVRNAFAPRPDDSPAGAAPDTYFVVKDANGALAYTRDGTFKWKEGTVTDAAGHAVLGRRSAEGPLEPIGIDPIDAALNIAVSPEIRPDGSVTYERSTLDPRTSQPTLERVLAGRIALARFPSGTQLQWRDHDRAVAPDGTTPHFSDASLDQLQHAYLSLDALRAAEVAQTRTQKSVMDLLK